VGLACAAACFQVGAGGLSRLITWQGSDASLQPVLFVSHVDVVPVTEETLKVRQHMLQLFGWGLLLSLLLLPEFPAVVLIVNSVRCCLCVSSLLLLGLPTSTACL
jgi:hypothetical protein